MGENRLSSVSVIDDTEEEIHILAVSLAETRDPETGGDILRAQPDVSTLVKRGALLDGR